MDPLSNSNESLFNILNEFKKKDKCVLVERDDDFV